MVMRLSHYDIAGGSIKQVTKIEYHWTNHQKIWTALRALRTFTSADLQMVLPTVNKDVIGKYISRLRKYGYLREIGKKGSYLHYRLIRDTGPSSPVQRYGRCYDRNTREYMKCVR